MGSDFYRYCIYRDIVKGIVAVALLIVFGIIVVVSGETDKERIRAEQENVSTEVVDDGSNKER